MRIVIKLLKVLAEFIDQLLSYPEIMLGKDTHKLVATDPEDRTMLIGIADDRTCIPDEPVTGTVSLGIINLL